MDLTKISLGKIKTFLQCPLKYKLAYVNNHPAAQKTGAGLNFYQALQTTLQYFHKEGMNPIPPLDFLLQLLERNWDSRGFKNEDEDKQHKEQAREILKNFYESYIREKPPVKFPSGTMVNFKTKRCLVSGRVDRIDQLPDGSYEVINYKTGRSVMQPAELARDLQAVVLYQGTNAHKRFERKVTKVSFYFLRRNRKVSVTPSRDDIKAVSKLIDDTAVAIRRLAKGNSLLYKAFLGVLGKMDAILPACCRRRFPVVRPEDLARRGPLCSTCDYLSLCLAWPVKPQDLAAEPPEKYDERLRLSYSKLGSYKRCPRAWKKVYLDDISPRPRPFFSFGTAIHETMENLYAPRGRRDPSLRYLLKCWNAAFKKHPKGYRDEEERKRYFEHGRKMLERYHRDFVAEGKYSPAFAIERYFEIPMGENAVMTGYIDRIDRLEDGTYEILDYKTEPTRRAQEQTDRDDQLTIYFWAAQTFLRLPIKQLSLLMLDFGERQVTTRREEDMPKVVAYIDSIAAEIQNNIRRHQREHSPGEPECALFPPRKNQYCRGCDHLDTCSLKDEILADQEIKSMEYE